MLLSNLPLGNQSLMKASLGHEKVEQKTLVMTDDAVDSLLGNLDVDESCYEREALGHEVAPVIESAVVCGEVALLCGREFARSYFGTTSRGAVVSAADRLSFSVSPLGGDVKTQRPTGGGDPGIRAALD